MAKIFERVYSFPSRPIRAMVAQKGTRTIVASDGSHKVEDTYCVIATHPDGTQELWLEGVSEGTAEWDARCLVGLGISD